MARELIENVASRRKNVIPIIEDARRPDSYFSVFGDVDLVYCDIAQSDQTDIAIKNCIKAFLKNKGALSYYNNKDKKHRRNNESKLSSCNGIRKIEEINFHINQTINLDPFDKDHALIHAYGLVMVSETFSLITSLRWMFCLCFSQVA